MEGRHGFNQWRFAQLLVLWTGKLNPPVGNRLRARNKMDHPVRVSVRIGIEEYRIHHAEDSGGRSNPQRQRDDCCQCEPRAFRQLPETIAKVLNQALLSSPPTNNSVESLRLHGHIAREISACKGESCGVTYSCLISQAVRSQ